MIAEVGCRLTALATAGEKPDFGIRESRLEKRAGPRRGKLFGEAVMQAALGG